VTNKNLDIQLKKIICGMSNNEITNDDIYDQSNLIDDLAFDSITIIELILELEEVFQIEIEDAEVEYETLIIYEKLYNFISSKNT